MTAVLCYNVFIMLEEIRWHAHSVDAAFDRLKSTRSGLSDVEVLERRKRYGPNELPKERPLAWWALFLRQFASPLIVILIIAAMVSLFLGERVDSAVIFAAVMLNTIIGFAQEFKASQAMEQLRSLVQPRAIVLRNGTSVDVFARELVPGDVLLLQMGDRVTADARLIACEGLKVDESPLTGESMSIEKTLHAMAEDTALAERTNMVFAGTSVVYGRAQAVVVGVGADSELGKIAALVSSTSDTQTPLQTELTQLARWIAMIVLGLTIVIFFLGLIYARPPLEMFQLSVALAVAAVPEGLVVSVTIILAIGMQRILRRKSLVRRLVAAETLGSVSIICSDKTGTITQGQMKATHIFVDGHLVDVTSKKHKDASRIRSVLEMITLCNDAILAKTENGDQAQGSPTERALLELAIAHGIDQDKMRAEHPRTAALPFESRTKFMVTAHLYGSESREFLKGAPDRVLEFCTCSTTQRAEIEKTITTLASKGMRVLAVASRSSKNAVHSIDEHALSGFTFEAFVGLQDPIRPEVAQQIAQARAAGVRTVMVTGDHWETAAAIAREAGLEATPESIVVGTQLDHWTDEQLHARITQITVFARVEPRHKIRIIQAWQHHGAVVAMTGDGVNDAPALKMADIGIAVGSGTEVAKQSADLILLDNNLGTITRAIEQGRVMFDNIRKSVVYLLSGSSTELVLISGSILLGFPMPLLPAHILWINLVADTFPNFGLTLEPGERDVMTTSPRSRTEPVLNRQMIRMIVLINMTSNIVLFSIFLWLFGQQYSIEFIRSIMFAAVGIDSLFYVFAVKSFRHTIFHLNPFSNRWLLWGVFVGFALMVLGFIHPFFQSILELVPLSLSDWVVLTMIAFIKLLTIELVKGRFILKQKHV